MDLIDLNENILLLFPQPIELLGVLEEACDLNRRHLICLPSLNFSLGFCPSLIQQRKTRLFLVLFFPKETLDRDRERKTAD